MKQHVLAVIALSLSLADHCAGSTNETTSSKPILQRGWIGGEFKTTKLKMEDGKRNAVYVQQVFPGTPSEQSGLHAGDLVLKVNDCTVKDLRSFRHLIDTATPGTRATFHVLRGDTPLELPVIVGRESYHQWHAIQLGLHLSSKLDLWPDPDFSLAPLARYDRVQERVELNSPKVMLTQHNEGSGGERGVHSGEGWNAWFVILGANAHKRILKQETVPARGEERS